MLVFWMGGIYMYEYIIESRLGSQALIEKSIP